jgi:hypothetical protein
MVYSRGKPGRGPESYDSRLQDRGEQRAAPGRGSGTEAIGLVIADVTNTFYGEIIKGGRRFCRVWVARSSSHNLSRAMPRLKLPPIEWASLYRPCSEARKFNGKRFLRARGKPTGHQRWSCSPALHIQHAGLPSPPWGPFYCPNDQKVYLDTAFFQDLERRFRGCDVGSKSCQFSQGYVITHEVGRPRARAARPGNAARASARTARRATQSRATGFRGSA